MRLKRLNFLLALALILFFVPKEGFTQLSANFGASDTSGCVTVVTNFTDTSVGSPVSWTWNFYFNGGTVSQATLTGSTVSRIFNKPGCHDVELIVVDAMGNRDTLRKYCYIEVFRNPSPSFTSNVTQGCSPLTIAFTNTTNPNAAALDTCTWIFITPSSNTVSSTALNPVLTFSEVGFYNIQLRCENNNGCDTTIIINNYFEVLPTPTARFTYMDTVGCTFPVTTTFTNTSQANGSTGLTYSWSFPAATPTTFTGPNPGGVDYGSVGAYTASLLVVSTSGCRDSMTRNLNIDNEGLNVDFTVIDSTVCLNEPVLFTNTTVITNGQRASRFWKLGDGNTTVRTSPSYTYTMVGSYTVTLTETTTNGCLDSSQHNIVVQSLPSANWTVSPTGGCDLSTVFNFTDLSANATSWLWNFGDGATSTLQNPSHTYNSFGTKNICLTITDMNGCDTTLCMPAVDLGGIMGSFSTDVDRGCAPFQANLMDLTSNPGDPVTSWQWIFDNNSGNITPGTSTVANPTVTVNVPGVFDVTMIIATAGGCLDTITIPGFLRAGMLPTIGFTISPPLACIKEPVAFSSTINDTSWNYFWDFEYPAGGFRMGDSNMVYAYEDTGCFNVALIIEDRGCRDTSIQSQIVCISPPKAQFQITPYRTCNTPQPVTILNNTIGPADIYEWYFDGVLISNSSTFSGFTFPTSLPGVYPPGTYPVKLIVTNLSSGCIDSATVNFQYGGPVADFNVADSVGCVPHTPTFIDNSLFTNTSSTWFYGDGISNNTGSHTYTTPGVYDVTLIARDNIGCTDTLTLPGAVTVLGAIAEYDALDTLGCVPLATFFNDRSTSFMGTVNAWIWNFGDGGTSNFQFPGHTYTSTGAFNVSLKVTDSNGCVDSISKFNYIEVIKPIADFAADDTITCLGNTVAFMDSSVGRDLTHFWTFSGNGNIDTSLVQNPIWSAPDTGFYTVTLIVTDSLGCSDTLIKPNYIYIETIFFDFSGTPRIGICPPLDVQFTDSIVGNVDSVWWNFGDNTGSNQRNPRHIFLDPGCYDIELIVFHEDGCVDSLLKICYIDIAGPTGTVDMFPDEICLGDTVFFNVTIDSAECIIMDPDDIPLQIWCSGTNRNVTDTVLLKHVYSAPGIFDPVVVIRDVRNCQVTLPSPGSVIVHAPPTASFTPSITAGCTPMTIDLTDTSIMGDTTLAAWQWTMPGASPTSSMVQNPTNVLYSNIGLYTISMTVTDDNGCVDSTSRQVEALPIPIAAFTASDTYSCAPVNIRFTDQSYNTPVSDWIWDFGDATPPLQGVQNPTHLYQNDGVYDVTLIVFDVNGCSDTLTKLQYIRLRHPTAYINPTPLYGCSPDILTLYADSSQIVSDTTLATYAWTWENPRGSLNTKSGAIGTAADSISDLFVAPGAYAVSLIVTDIFGCTDTVSDSVNIYNLPIARFNPSDLDGCAPFSPVFRDSSTLGDAPIAVWDWDFGDPPSTGTGPVVGYSYTVPNIYNVTLTVTDQFGCTDDTTVAITVHDSPIANFVASDTFNCSPIDITFTDLSYNTTVVDWIWTYGDGNLDIAIQNPTHRYQNDGFYDVSLIAIDDNGCSDTLTKPQYIHLRHPVASFVADSAFGCIPFTITFLGEQSQLLSDTTIAKYIWGRETGASTPGFVVDTTFAPTDSFQQTYVSPGTWDVFLVVEDVFGCRDTLLEPDLVTVNPFVTPDPLDIEYVSVIDQHTVEIVIEQFPLPSDFNKYIVYWENRNGVFLAIDSSTNINNTRFVHKDQNLDTHNRPNCYKVIVENICFNRSSFTLTQESCTILLDTSTPDDDMIRLDWSDYVGWNANSYEIYRANNGYDTTRLSLVARVAGDVLFYEDYDMFCRDSVYYRVKALRGNGSPTRSFSNVRGDVPNHPDPTERVNIAAASVRADSIVDITWPPYLGYKPARFILEKSLDGFVWELLDSLPPTQFLYTDPDVLVDERSYFYHLFVLDSCGDVSGIGLFGKTIVLEVVAEGRYPRLNWTHYEEWANGVLNYEIEVFNSRTSSWEFVDIVPGNQNTYLDGRTVLRQQDYCYRVTALEANGLGSRALSNEDCTIFAPAIYAPNAFSPNGDDRNDKFFVVGPDMRNVTLKIFNRWGRLIWQTNDLDEGWDGRYKGKDVQEGVYVFTLTAEGLEGAPIELVGSITLIR